jgi:hypothetical protein
MSLVASGHRRQISSDSDRRFGPTRGDIVDGGTAIPSPRLSRRAVFLDGPAVAVGVGKEGEA